MRIEELNINSLAQCVADVAATEIMSRYGRVVAKQKRDGSVLTRADTAVQAALSNILAEQYPGIRLLGEEMSPGVQKDLLSAGSDWLWCLDPLDGTGNFAAGIPMFSVSLALVRDGKVVAGVVHDPVRVETFSALRDSGAWLNGQVLKVPESTASDLPNATALVDFKRLPPRLATELATRAPYRSQRSFGSVALDWCWIAAGRCHVYLHGGQRLWDYAAGSLVAAEAGAAGGLYSDFRGERQCQLTLVPAIGIAASSAKLFDQWATWISDTDKGSD